MFLIGEPVPTPDQVRGRLSPEHARAAVPGPPLDPSFGERGLDDRGIEIGGGHTAARRRDGVTNAAAGALMGESAKAAPFFGRLRWLIAAAMQTRHESARISRGDVSRRSTAAERQERCRRRLHEKNRHCSNDDSEKTLSAQDALYQLGQTMTQRHFV
jgi:hypothetical protein